MKGIPSRRDNFSRFRFLTIDKDLKGAWGDSVKTTQIQTEILQRKRLLLSWYRKIYSYMAENLSKETVSVEIGSGSSRLYEHIDGLIRSNIIYIKGNDLTFSAYHMPFKSESVGNIILISVLHHLDDPFAFFREAQRVLKRGGRVLISDPYLSKFSYPIWRYLHPENCDRKRLGFNNEDNMNPLTNANSANASILFSSDRIPFSKSCPDLVVKNIKLHSKFYYWLAGGYNFPQPFPSRCDFIIDFLEEALAPLDKWLASFMFVVIEKKKKR